MNTTTLLRIKDIKSLLSINSDAVARRILNDIKNEFKINFVLYHHFLTYFKI